MTRKDVFNNKNYTLRFYKEHIFFGLFSSHFESIYKNNTVYRMKQTFLKDSKFIRREKMYEYIKLH